MDERWIHSVGAIPPSGLPGAAGLLRARRLSSGRVEFELIVAGAKKQWQSRCPEGDLQLVRHQLTKSLRDLASEHADRDATLDAIGKEAYWLWELVVDDPALRPSVGGLVAAIAPGALNIEATDVAVPWEFVALAPTDGDAERAPRPPLWGTTLPLHRIIDGHAESWQVGRSVAYSRSPAVGLVCDPTLPAVSQVELKFFRDRVAGGALLLNAYPDGESEAGEDEVLARIAEVAASSQVLVFSVHGSGADLAKDVLAGVRVPPDRWWTERQIREQRPKLTGGPIALLNSCLTGSVSDGFTPVSLAVYQWGARAVVAPEFIIPDPQAGGFTVDFITELLAGKSVGAAVFDARRRLWDSGNAIGLAFAVYANADARLTKDGDRDGR
jgi:hypothetical protein